MAQVGRRYGFSEASMVALVSKWGAQARARLAVVLRWARNRSLTPEDILRGELKAMVRAAKSTNRSNDFRAHPLKRSRTQ